MSLAALSGVAVQRGAEQSKRVLVASLCDANHSWAPLRVAEQSIGFDSRRRAATQGAAEGRKYMMRLVEAAAPVEGARRRGE